jgi:hypothetical protein
VAIGDFHFRLSLSKVGALHKVFGASNVAKLLNELNTSEREAAVNMLTYEAESRLQDPVYGCVGLVSLLQHKLREVKTDFMTAKKELYTYIGPQAMLPINIQHQGFIPQQQVRIDKYCTMNYPCLQNFDRQETVNLLA